MKYIIDIEEKPLCVFDKDTQTYFPRLWRVKGFNSLVFDEEGLSRLEELTVDYINEHYGSLQDEAYQRGLDDAWEAAKKIAADMWSRIRDDVLLAIFRIPERIDYSTINTLFDEQTASEAIEKLKAYEEKQKADGEIKVGDEVISLRKNGEVIEDMSPWIVTYETKYSYQGFEAGGMFHKNPKDSVRKTGRHFDIEKILEEMRE